MFEYIGRLHCIVTPSEHYEITQRASGNMQELAKNLGLTLSGNRKQLLNLFVVDVRK